MRPIKFRARIKGTTAPFVFGSLRVDDGKTYIGWRNENGWFEDEVDPESVGQFTGLLDKNSVEIYEGDIIYGRSTWRGKNMATAVVEWRRGGFYLRFRPITDWYSWEIIGNVYEHPNLLSDTKQTEAN